jgi:hypothetical protein
MLYEIVRRHWRFQRLFFGKKIYNKEEVFLSGDNLTQGKLARQVVATGSRETVFVSSD